MTQEIRTVLKAGWVTTLTDGGGNTAAEVRAELDDIADSCFNILTDTASNVINTPAGSIAATTVQAAINELDTEKLATSDFTDALISTSDITTNNATTLKHGFLPKLSNISTQFLNGQGNYATPSGTSNSYLLQAFTAQTSVTVTHNFGTYPVVCVLDNTGAVLLPLTITHTSVNAFTVTFSTSTTGNIVASVGSPQPNTFITVANNYTVLVTDYFVNNTSSGKTSTLPTAVGNSGRVFQIINSSTGDITVDTTSSQTINGALTQILPRNSCMSVVSDGTNYIIF